MINILDQIRINKKRKMGEKNIDWTLWLSSSYPDTHRHRHKQDFCHWKYHPIAMVYIRTHTVNTHHDDGQTTTTKNKTI